LDSWPRDNKREMMGQKPREAARWRDVFERPVGEVSGFWRSVGCDFMMRERRRASLVWIERRRRREGSILLKGQFVSYLERERGGSYIV